MKILNPPIKVTCEILIFLFECTKRNKGCTKDEILRYIGKTESYVLNSISFLKENSLINEKESKLFLSKENIKIVDGDEESAKKLIKNCLVNNRLFVEYSHFLSNGKKPSESARILKTIYNIDHKEESIIKIFDDWIKFLKIDVKVKPTKNKVIEKLEQSNNIILANKFLKEEFGSFYKKISSEVIKDLRDAILNLKTKKEDTLNDGGRALEDFLRLDLAPHLNLGKCKGIVQITNELNKYPEYPTKLNNIAASMGNVRTMGKAHGADAELKGRWTITESAAISYIVIIICLMKSYLEYKINKKIIF